MLRIRASVGGKDILPYFCISASQKVTNQTYSNPEWNPKETASDTNDPFRMVVRTFMPVTFIYFGAP